ncbi:MAG: hypothetical protein JEZ06_09450 [Anaerolineaceae bacterium]|nr:hypothetical protein [Anaerolineaceae bacterium]
MNQLNEIRITQSEMTMSNHWDHFLARWGYRRNDHRVDPGLYAIGNPNQNSPVFVTANYSLSFDALRSSIQGLDGYILVLDTQGINVWCAAGKGTFGTVELIHQIEASRLKEIVDHREVIVPQLGAPGIIAHEVKSQSGFRIIYGPVRAKDLPEFMQNHKKASPQMRKVEFPLWERLILSPMEIVHVLVPMVISIVVLGLLLNWMTGISVAAGLLSGSLLFPILLPFLPGKEFGLKGLALGILTALPFSIITWAGMAESEMWLRVINSLFYLMAIPPIVAYLGLNFTGSSTYTSRSGVKREIFRYAPIMVVLLILAIVDLIFILVLKY